MDAVAQVVLVALGGGFEKISLAGMTGTEKQRQYAQDLADNLLRNAELNSTPGYSTYEDGGKRYTPPEDAEAVAVAYNFMRAAVENRNTYGDVISFLRSQNIFRVADSIKGRANKEGKSIKQYGEELLKQANEMKRKKK